MSLSLAEFFILCASLFLIAFLALEMINWSKIISLFETNHNLTVFENKDGENLLQSLSEKSSGSYEAPVNIISRQAVVIELSEPLKWNGYDVLPIAMTMTNIGERVIIQGYWTRGLVPTISSGPLRQTYQLHSISLRWSASDQFASEHTINQVKYPFEVQLLHVKRPNQRLVITEADECDVDAAIVSYLFQIKENDNSQLDPIVMNLCRIQDSNSKVYIPPFQLDCLFPLFERKFYSYNELLSQESEEMATWIIYPEPLYLSRGQVEKFQGVLKGHSRKMRVPRPQDLYYHE